MILPLIFAALVGVALYAGNPGAAAVFVLLAIACERGIRRGGA